MDIVQTPQWQALQQHWQQVQHLHMRELFAQDEQRFDHFSLQACGLLLDYSKNRVTADTLEKLLALTQPAALAEWIERMFSGEHINHTEERAVMHVALRNRTGAAMSVDGQDVSTGVREVLQAMEQFVARVHSGEWLGHSGRRIRQVVNIGIGGSHLGPLMVYEALAAFHQPGIQVHFVSNVDILNLNATLSSLDPQETLFIVSSKTFTTQETMSNAHAARDWLLQAYAGDETAIARHFVAVSTNAQEVSAFGIDTDNMFAFWDWVGGRYSLWSAIGLSVALGIGMQNFYRLLDGANNMDEHFRSAPFAENMPVILALLGIWYNNFAGAQTQAILPYNWYLRLLPPYLQQLDMESNGKRISREGELASCDTSPVVWGGSGADGQHAYFQLLHQGEKVIPCDFIAAVRCGEADEAHQQALLAAFMAQTEALMRGLTGDEARAEMLAAGMSEEQVDFLQPHKTFPGNHPTNAILMDELTPQRLGSLIALYEHKVFVQGVIWNLNSFDQWGVELGKKLATNIRTELAERQPAGHDSSTLGQMQFIFANQDL